MLKNDVNLKLLKHLIKYEFFGKSPKINYLTKINYLKNHCDYVDWFYYNKTLCSMWLRVHYDIGRCSGLRNGHRHFYRSTWSLKKHICTWSLNNKPMSVWIFNTKRCTAFYSALPSYRVLVGARAEAKISLIRHFRFVNRLRWFRPVSYSDGWNPCGHSFSFKAICSFFQSHQSR